MIAPTSSRVSVGECRDFLIRVEALLRMEEDAARVASDVSIDGCQHFLNQAERLAPTPTPLADCEAFLEEAEQRVSKHWSNQIDRLRDADPHDHPGFQAVNLLRVFGISRREGAHSRFLGWLLDPQESHDLGTGFLGPFLALAQRTCGREFEVLLKDVQIELEHSTDKGVPDITIVGSNFTCVVENKILAVEGQDQTQRYADAGEQEARERGIPTDHLLLLFLSPTGREPKDSRFHPLSYPAVLRLLQNVPTCDALPVVGIAIKQFVFNLQARVLHEYDHEMATLTHLKGYDAAGDRYLREYWREISGLARELREIDNMSTFDGFSELSLLYAEKYDLVEVMQEEFSEEREQLFQDLQNRIADSSWFDTERLTLYTSGPRFQLRLRDPEFEGNLARIQLRLDPSRLGRRELYSDLWLVTQVSDMQSFKHRFQQATGQQLIEMFDVADYKTSGRYLIRRRNIPFEVDTILDTMIEEVEKLQRLLPYVEEVYLDLIQEQI